MFADTMRGICIKYVTLSCVFMSSTDVSYYFAVQANTNPRLQASLHYGGTPTESWTSCQTITNALVPPPNNDGWQTVAVEWSDLEFRFYSGNTLYLKVSICFLLRQDKNDPAF